MHRGALTPVVLGLTLAVSACGSSSSHSASSSHAPGTRTTATRTVVAESSQAAAETESNIANRSRNELVLDGFSQGSLSQLAYQDYRKQGGSDVLSIENDSAPAAFSNLCEGNADVVDSSSAISGAALRLCQQHGVTPVQLQVGSDAVVLATENETDVGADCLTLAQVKAIYKAGSPVENWDQLGFDDVPLATAGPNPVNAEFSFFGPLLVGANSPTLSDFRFDYRSEPNEDRIRQFVVGRETQGELASAALPTALGQITSLDHLIAGWEATLRGAKAYLRSATQQNNATAIALAAAKQNNALAALSSLRAERRAEENTVTRDHQIEATAESVLGHLGVFEYGYYTLYEEQLRPLEISAQASHENCVFPSQETITSGDYPLSRQLLLTVSLQELRRNVALRAFLLSYLKNAGTLITHQVLVPLPNNVLVQEEDWLTGTRLPTSGTATTPSATENSMSGGNPSTGQGAPTGMSQGTGSGTGASASNAGAGQGLVPPGVH